jgi:Na+/glutamate symporter
MNARLENIVALKYTHNIIFRFFNNFRLFPNRNKQHQQKKCFSTTCFLKENFTEKKNEMFCRFFSVFLASTLFSFHNFTLVVVSAFVNVNRISSESQLQLSFKSGAGKKFAMKKNFRSKVFQKCGNF